MYVHMYIIVEHHVQSVLYDYHTSALDIRTYVHVYIRKFISMHHMSMNIYTHTHTHTQQQQQQQQQQCNSQEEDPEEVLPPEPEILKTGEETAK